MLAPSATVDFGRLIGPVARVLLGAPNTRLSKPYELRFGNNGSLSVDLRKGVWRDHEGGCGGGTLDLIQCYVSMTVESGPRIFAQKGPRLGLMKGTAVSARSGGAGRGCTA
jgi:hypothetical protein